MTNSDTYGTHTGTRLWNAMCVHMCMRVHVCACLMLILLNEDEVRETNALQLLKPFRYLRQTVNGTILELVS